MVKKILHGFSAVAAIILCSGVLFAVDSGEVLATGTNQIEVMSMGSDAVQETARSNEIAGGLAALVIIVGGFRVAESHGMIGFAGLLIVAVAAGLIIQSAEALEQAGYTAAVL